MPLHAHSFEDLSSDLLGWHPSPHVGANLPGCILLRTEKVDCWCTPFLFEKEETSPNI